MAVDYHFAATRVSAGKRVFKKVSSSWLKATHPKGVQGTRTEDQARTGRIEEDFTTDNTDIMHESALLLN